MSKQFDISMTENFFLSQTNADRILLKAQLKHRLKT